MSVSESRLFQFQELLARALKRFSILIGGAPSASDTWIQDCQESLKVFSDLWKFQQDHRSTLVEAGLTRADIGEIASKIGQLYYNLYLRTSGPSWLLESYTFFEAIHTRAYFSAGGLNQSVKQLKFYARFIIVCLLLNRKEEAWNLVQEFQALVSTFAMKFAAEEAQEWQAVVHSVTAFLNADVAMPVPRSPGTCIPYRPNFRCCADGPEALVAPHTKRLREAIFASYQHRQVKIAELPIDTFRMMLALEWHDPRLHVTGMETDEMEAAFPTVHSTPGASAVTAAAPQPPETDRGEGSGSSAAAPPSLPGDASTAASETQIVALSEPTANLAVGSMGGPGIHAQESPYKRLLHRTCAPVLLNFLAAAALGCGQDDVLLLHLVGHGYFEDMQHQQPQPQQQPPQQQPPQQPPIDAWSTFNITDLQQQLAAARLGSDHTWQSLKAGPTPAELGAGAVSGGLVQRSEPFGSGSGSGGASGGLGNGAAQQRSPVGVLLSPASGEAEVAQSIVTPEDILPFTRRRLMLVVDSDASPAFSRLHSCSGCPPPLCLLSPPQRPSALLSYTGTGAFFTMALACPVMAFCLLLGELDPSAQQLLRLQDALDDATTQLGKTLAAALGLAPAAATPPLPGDATPSATDGPGAAANSGADTGAILQGSSGGGGGGGGGGRGGSHSPWAAAFSDVLLRRLVLRFVLIRAALSMHISTRDHPDCQASCTPALPELVAPGAHTCCSAVLSVAAVFQKEHLFVCAPQPPPLAR